MKIKTIIKNILSVFGFGNKEEKNNYNKVKLLVGKVEDIKKEISGVEKPIHFISQEFSTENIKIRAKIKELEKRKLNFCFIPEKQNSINVRSMLEFIYRELPKKAPYDYNGKLRFFLWSKTRKILEKKYVGKDCFVCQLCGESGIHQGFKHHTECHEVWEFNNKYKTAILNDLMVLCPNCHKVAHINMHENNEEMFAELKARYCYINELFIKGETGLEPDDDKFKEDYYFAISERESRKNKLYNLDITFWYKRFKKSIIEDNKKDYFEFNKEYVRFKTNNEEFLNFLESEFKDRKNEG